ncbi:MAG: segregation and condensation protein A [Patescibacteria group bacterium]
MYKIQTEKYSGPLDLLLKLIEDKKFEITEISLGKVTDQYLARIEKMADKPAEELADFLVIAAKLLLLKSKAILPVMEEDEEPDELEKQLRIYKEFYEASKIMNKILLSENFSFGRERPPMPLEVEFAPPKDLAATDLMNTFIRILKKLDPLIHLPKVSIKKAISLQATIMDLQNSIKRFRKIDFSKITQKAKSKTELIVHFLALLELMKRQDVEAEQSGVFGNILVKKI